MGGGEKPGRIGGGNHGFVQHDQLGVMRHRPAEGIDGLAHTEVAGIGGPGPFEGQSQGRRTGRHLGRRQGLQAGIGQGLHRERSPGGPGSAGTQQQQGRRGEQKPGHGAPLVSGPKGMRVTNGSPSSEAACTPHSQKQGAGRHGQQERRNQQHSQPAGLP